MNRVLVVAVIGLIILLISPSHTDAHLDFEPQDLSFERYLTNNEGDRKDPINLIFVGGTVNDVIVYFQRYLPDWEETTGADLIFVDHNIRCPQDRQLRDDLPPTSLHIRLKQGFDQDNCTQRHTDPLLGDYVLAAVHLDRVDIDCPHQGDFFDEARDVIANAFATNHPIGTIPLQNTEPTVQCKVLGVVLSHTASKDGIAKIIYLSVGDVGGLVKISSTGEVVSDAEVKFQGEGLTRTTKTDADGRYLFSNVPPGKATIIATKSGVGTSSIDVTVYADTSNQAPDILITPSSSCFSSSTFIADVTYPDGSALSPGQSFNKTWRLQNTGTCTWSGYTLAFVSGVQMGGPSSVPVPTTERDKPVDITVPLVAPQHDGTYRGDWRLRDAQGVYFGDQVWVIITVPPAVDSCTPTADQVALFVDINYNGQCVVKGIGEYPNPGAIGLPNDSISSLWVGANVKAVLCRDDGITNTCEWFENDDNDLNNNS